MRRSPHLESFFLVYFLLEIVSFVPSDALDLPKPTKSRRNLLQDGAALSTAAFLPSAALAGTIPISASWSAVNGLNTNDDKVVAFDEAAYQAMVRDTARTPFFETSIVERLGRNPESQTVLDLGTGPYALFALMAAKNGAGKVYAMEGNPAAAASARAAVTKAGFDDVITVLEGFSTDLELPNKEKADFCIAEIIGSVVSEEGVYPTILDAHKRLVKDPNNPQSWIPNRVQTLAAPASYTLHNLFQPPAFDWDKIRNVEPVRFNCKDEGLQLLSQPQVVEDINFAEIDKLSFGKKEMNFKVDKERIEENRPALVQEFKLGRLPAKEVDSMARTTASSFTGVAMWPRLLLPSRNDNAIEINSRSYPDGNHQRSHWQTVLPIMSSTPVPVQGGDEIQVTLDFTIPNGFQKPPFYSITGNVVST